ncbi:MAG: glycosyltransferase [Actinomycetota bacterium]
MAADERVKGSRLVIDASPARMGGGASRTRELRATIDALAPDLRTTMVVAEAMARDLPAPTESFDYFRIPAHWRSVPLRLLWQQALLPRHLRAYRPDWVLSPFNVLPLGSGAPDGIQRAVIVGNIGPFEPQVISTGSAYQRARNDVLRRMTLASVHRADRVFLLSRQAGQLLGSDLDPSRTTLIPMAPPPPGVLARAAARLDDRPMKPFAVVVGDLYPYKAVEDAIRAVAPLRTAGVACELLVVGSPMDRRYRERLRDVARRLEAPVRFLGAVPHDQTLALMKEAIATVLCSRVENTSRVPVEAIAAGSPLVLADVPNLRDTAGDGAEYYTPGDVVALSGILGTLATDDDARADLVSRGRRELGERDWLSATRCILETLQLL